MIGDISCSHYLRACALDFHAILVPTDFCNIWVFSGCWNRSLKICIVRQARRRQKNSDSVTKVAVAHSTKYRKQSKTTDTNISLQNSEYRMWYFDNYEQDFGSSSGSLILWRYEPYEKSCLVLLRISWGFGSQQIPGLSGFCWSVDTGFYLGIIPGYFSLHKTTSIGIWVSSNQILWSKLGPDMSFTWPGKSFSAVRGDLKSWCSCRSREPCPSSPHHLGGVAGQLSLVPAAVECWALSTFTLQPLFVWLFFFKWKCSSRFILCWN